MIEMTRQRLAVLLLLLSVGAAAAVTFAVIGGRHGTPAASGDNTGTGTVVGAEPSAEPTPGTGGTGTPGTGGTDGTGGTPGTGGTGGVTGTFSISGQVGGLVPGRTGTLTLTVTNPNPWPIRVLTLDTGVAAPAGQPCPASLLSVGRYTATDGSVFKAPARGTVTVDVPVRLADSMTQDQNGCPGSAFPLVFTGTAVETS